MSLLCVSPEGAGSVSGDMCNESDAVLDVLAAQGARL